MAREDERRSQCVTMLQTHILRFETTVQEQAKDDDDGYQGKSSYCTYMALGLLLFRKFVGKKSGFVLQKIAKHHCVNYF